MGIFHTRSLAFIISQSIARKIPRLGAWTHMMAVVDTSMKYEGLKRTLFNDFSSGSVSDFSVCVVSSFLFSCSFWRWCKRRLLPIPWFLSFHRVHTHICLRYVLYPTHFYLTSLHITIHLLILLTSPLSPHQPHPIYPHLSLSSSFVYFEISRIPLDMFQDGVVRAQYSHPQVTTRQTQTTRLHIITLIILHYAPRLHLDKYSNILPNTISTFVSSFTT